MQTTVSAQNLVSLNKWLTRMGVTPTTGWRWRKKGILQTTNIYGRLYISEAAITEFESRAAKGEFAIPSNPGKRSATENKKAGNGSV